MVTTTSNLGTWLIAGTSVDQPYPCRCAERKYSRCSPKYCPCAGRTDLSGLPNDCCAHRTVSVVLPDTSGARHPDPGLPGAPRGSQIPGRGRPVAARHPGGAALTDPDGLESSRRVSDGPRIPDAGVVPPERLPVSRESSEIPERGHGSAARPPREPLCPCPTPWDAKKSAGGVHCSDCHVHCASAAVFHAHRPGVLAPCRELGKITDVDTGAALYRLQMMGGHPVWASVGASSWKPPARPAMRSEI